VVDRSPASDPYVVLGVAPDATREDIVRSYRRLARISHPDLRPDDQAAVARFRALTDAYGLLSDPIRRAGYDRGRGEARVGMGRRMPEVRVHEPSSPSHVGRPAYISDDHPASTYWLWAGPVEVQPQSSGGIWSRSPSAPAAGISELAALLCRLLDDSWWPR
jgi:curved DNA-binding protein CbpA